MMVRSRRACNLPGNIDWIMSPSTVLGLSEKLVKNGDFSSNLTESRGVAPGYRISPFQGSGFEKDLVWEWGVGRFEQKRRPMRSASPEGLRREGFHAAFFVVPWSIVLFSCGVSFSTLGTPNGFLSGFGFRYLASLEEERW